MKPITCMKCKSINPITHRFCKLCGFALDEKSAQSIIIQENKRQDIDNLMNKLFQDKDILRAYLRIKC